MAGVTRACRGGKPAPASSVGERDEQLIKLFSREQQTMLLLHKLLVSPLKQLNKLLLTRLPLGFPALDKLLLLLDWLLLDKLRLLHLQILPPL